VLYRLQQHDHVAYLVGGSVRDLILGRRPKDFDIGTDAHPYEIKRLFRNCWIIGRRFRLAHIKFGQKTIEVATFRKNVTDLPAETTPDEPADPVVVASAAPGLPVTGTLTDDETEDADDGDDIELTPAQRAVLEYFGGGSKRAPRAGAGRPRAGLPLQAGVSRADSSAEARSAKAEARNADSGIVHRDNTFGTTEEDAFRRDFTVNALFYDAATKSIIDYVGGLNDLERRIIRSIGDPRVRFVEDPVRMLRAAVLGARLGFELDGLVVDAIAELRGLITKASSARLLEEYFKILRSGSAEVSFRALDRVRLLELMTPELASPPEILWDSLARLDRYRQQHQTAPAELTTAILIGALLHPIGALNRRAPDRGAADDMMPDRVSFGALPVARKDLDRLRHLLLTIPRLVDPALPPRVARGLPNRPSFSDAVTWLEIFSNDPDQLAHWKQVRTANPPRPSHGRDHGHRHGPRPHGTAAASGTHAPHQSGAPAGDGQKRRRRRRRRRGRGGSSGAAS
jgi:poly(A) polymerase